MMLPPNVKMKISPISNILTLLLLLVFAPNVQAFWRHLCHGELGQARIDPIVSPGRAASHVHALFGASNFGFDSSTEDLLASNCTTCAIKEDKSVYWAPQLYFEHNNGTFEVVPKYGGMTIYYFSERPDVGQEVTAFPRGFRMVAGHSLKREFFGIQPVPDMSSWGWQDMTQQALMEKSLGFNCLNYLDAIKTEGALQFHGLRDKSFLDTNCPSGMRAEIQFPSCWNGVDLDSTNHTTHVAYPSRLRNGECPPGFDVRLPTLFFETIYATDMFHDSNGRFVFANGDPTGYGYHADFLNGWEDGVLQQAIDDFHCTTHDPRVFVSQGVAEDCPVFHLKADAEATACTMEVPEPLQKERIDNIKLLPGNVKIETGPGYATMSHTFPSSDTSVIMVPTSSTSTFTTPTASPVSNAFPDTTLAAEPPMITAAPTVTSASSRMLHTSTSVFVSNGTTFHLVQIEEIVTTTVTVAPNLSTGPVKRHDHAHRHHHGRHGRY